MRLATLQAMITAGHSGEAPPEGKRWLFEIVANGRNSIDVDKASRRAAAPAAGLPPD
jgi:hypothetical protein